MGRRSKRQEIKVDELCKLAVCTVNGFLNSDAPEDQRVKIAIEIVKKYMPVKLEGELVKNAVNNYSIEVHKVYGTRDKEYKSESSPETVGDMGSGRKI